MTLSTDLLVFLLSVAAAYGSLRARLSAVENTLKEIKIDLTLLKRRP